MIDDNDGDEPISRPTRLRKLAKDETKLGQGNAVERARKKFQLEQKADDDEAVSSGAQGNPMRYLGTMRHIK
jgi:hypothetical protein